MNKLELISKVAETINAEELLAQKLTKKDATVIVDTVFNTIVATLVDGEDIKVAGFGKFSVVERAERQGVNPQNPTEKITISARKAPKFTASSALKTVINE